MKKTMLSLAIALCTILNVKAKIITVSQNFTTPADYEDLQEAIDASVANDTIYVSVGSYGDITINKKLTLIGVGFDINNFSYVDKVTFVNTIDANPTMGTTLKGFNIENVRFSVVSNTNSLGKTFKNLFFSKCKFRGGGTLIFDTHIYNGFIFRNCAIGDGNLSSLLSRSNHFNHIFENCYLENSLVNTSSNNVWDYFNITFRNCILDRNIAKNSKGITIENSIILSSFGSESRTLRDNTYNNNLFTGSGIAGLDTSNIVNADPLFEDGGTGGFSRYNNYRLKEGSPAKGKGINGTDIGMFGGNYPFEDYSSSIPRIISLRGENDVNQIKAGESLKIEIVAEANSNNK